MFRARVFSIAATASLALGIVMPNPVAAQAPGDDPEPVESEQVDDQAPESESADDPIDEPDVNDDPAPDPVSESPTADRDGGGDDSVTPSGPRPGSIEGPATTRVTPSAPTDGLERASRVAVEEPEVFDAVVSSSPHQVVITEIMYNPSAVYDSRGEWFEVLNPTDAPVDLTGWTFGDEIYDSHTISSLTIPAGERAVLTRFDDQARNGGVDSDYDYGDAVLLFNVGDRIVLRDAAGLVADSVDYSLDGFPDPTGKSIALVETAIDGDNADAANWCISTTPMPQGDHGSPGTSNQCDDPSAQLVITEILNNPGRTSDFIGEWFELTNIGSATIDLDGFAVKDDDGDRFTIDASVLVEADSAVVLGVSDDAAVNGGVDVAYAYGDAMRLHNSFDELVVVDERGIEIDAVRWDDGRTFPDPNGASMTLTDVTSDNVVGEHWCASARRWAGGDYGSPGSPGDCTAPTYPDVVITEAMFDPERTSSERQGEWFEIANVGNDVAVLDGFVLQTYSTDHEISALSIPAGERAVLAVNGDPLENGGLDVDYVYGESLPLYNTTSTLEIVAPDGMLLDRVKWSAPLGFPNEKGSSIELRSTSSDNSLGANWCAATVRYGDGDFGTPGTAGMCLEPLPPVPLVISEVMRNPATVLDSRGEWFEIHNPTGDPVDLRNWSVGDDGSEHHVIGESVVVDAGGYAVIARSGDMSINGGVNADYVIGDGMVLINSIDELVLSDHYGRVVDRFAWDTTNLMPRPNGGSVARVESAMRSLAPNSDVSNWCVTDDQYGAGDRGTPGASNACPESLARSIVINEIHRDPNELPDAQGEWIELHNRSEVDIDISGWTLRDDDVDSYVFDEANPVVIEAGGYLVAGRNTHELNGGIEIDVQYGVEFIHFNTTDEVVLLDGDLAVVDRVAWTSSNGFPKVPGAAMTLRSPELDNSIGANWCAAVIDQGNGDFGTPGAANTCVLPPEPGPTDITHSLFAVADSSCRGEIKMNGSSIFVGTDIRSNHDIKTSGSTIRLEGAVSYGSGFQANGSSVVTLQTPVHEPATQVVPFGWQLVDFAPGGVHALAAAAYTHHTDGWTVTGSGSDLTPGIHYVDGDVSIRPEHALMNGVTVVATGKITIQSGSISLSPAGPGLPSLFAAYDTCSTVGINLSSGSITTTGAVFAPFSEVKASGSLLTTTDGSFVGTSVQFSGSLISINAPVEPPTPPTSDSAFVRITAMCRGIGADEGSYLFRVRHERESTGPFDYELKVGGTVLHTGVIDSAEVQMVWLPTSAKGVKVIPAGDWTNEYGGTASSNGNMCQT